MTQHFDTNSLVARVHGNTKKSPHNELPFDSKVHFKTFVTNFAEENTVTLPGRIPGYRDDRILLLPSHMTKDSIFNYYKASCEMAEVSPVGRSLYYSLWNELVPYIVLAKPMTDLCWVCQQNSQLIIDKQGEELEVMSDTVQAHLNHLKLAITEQKYYQEQCKLGADHHSTCSANRALSKNKPCSFDGVAHYSWNYAQQTHYPHNPFQP